MADTPVGNGAASWPDVVLAYIAFARDHTLVFAIAHAILVAVLLSAGWIVWMLLPRATKVLVAQYKLERERRAEAPPPPKQRPPRRKR
jgi:hypothetical protein